MYMFVVGLFWRRAEGARQVAEAVKGGHRGWLQKHDAGNWERSAERAARVGF